MIVTKPVPDAPGYFARTDGTVWSTSNRKYSKRLAGSRDKSGYLQVIICVDGKQFARKIHRLVLEAHVGKRPDEMQCRHLNGDRRDNRLENICWGTIEENMADKVRHGTNGRGSQNAGAVLTESQVLQIRERVKHETTRKVADEFGVAVMTVHRIKTRQRWGWLASCVILCVLVAGCVPTVRGPNYEAEAAAAVAIANVAISGQSTVKPSIVIEPDEPDDEHEKQSEPDPVKTVKLWYRCEKCGRVGWKETSGPQSPIETCPDPTCRGLMKLYETP